VVRGYAATIRANRAVSDALKINLGLHVRDSEPTPVPPPSTVPVLAVIGMRQGMQEVRVTDESTPGSRARPVGSAGMILFRAIDETAVTNPAQAQFLAFTGKTDFTCEYGPGRQRQDRDLLRPLDQRQGRDGPLEPADAGLDRGVSPASPPAGRFKRENRESTEEGKERNELERNTALL
jgi:hypothetical protein